MIRNRQAPSRATPTTTCQKCLKKGHFSYECTSSVQERPYASRASRTQQLFNPRLKPKLDESVPAEFIKKKDDVKESALSKTAEKRKPLEASARRSRSASYSSVSTISTRGSRSPPTKTRHMHPSHEEAMDGLQDSSRTRAGMKRGRSFSASPSLHTDSSSPPRHKVNRDDRNTRRRHSSVSPAPRGRALYGERRRSTEYDSYGSSSPERQDKRRRKDSIDRSRVARERAYAPDQDRKQACYDADDRDGRVHSTRYGQEPGYGDESDRDGRRQFARVPNKPGSPPRCDSRRPSYCTSHCEAYPDTPDDSPIGSSDAELWMNDAPGKSVLEDSGKSLDMDLAHVRQRFGEILELCEQRTLRPTRTASKARDNPWGESSLDESEDFYDQGSIIASDEESDVRMTDKKRRIAVLQDEVNALQHKLNLAHAAEELGCKVEELAQEPESKAQ